MKKVEKPKKPLLFYYLVAMVVLILLNTFLFPLLIRRNQITEVDYGTFLNMVESKEVSRVELNGDSIYFVDTDKEEPKYYATTTFDDPELVNRLEDAGCEFGRVAEKEMNPVLNFLLVWVLPRYVTCSGRRMKRHHVLCLLMKLIPLVKSVTAAAMEVTMNVSRP